MGFFSSIASVVSNVVSSVTSVASNVWEKTKSVARSAVSWMAEKAEGVIDKVKKVFQTVKKHIPAIRSGLQAAAKVVPWPWLKTGLNILDKGLAFIENFENTPLAKKISNAISKVINMAKDIKSKFFTDEELTEAKEREVLFQEAEAAVAGNSEAEKTLALGKMINAYGIINREVFDLLSEKSDLLGFEHYLRLRATQKLLLEVEETLVRSQSIESISEDDFFLIDIANELLKEEPELDSETAARLDQLIYERKGKNLFPFVFEELILAWYKSLEDLESEWKQEAREVSKLKIEHKRLKNELIISGLSEENAKRLNELEALLPLEMGRVDLLAKRKRETTSYVYAAEGLMQTIEKNESELENEGLSFLIEDSAEIGQLIINCMQHGTKWEDLTEEEKAMILDYANIFEEACKERSQALLEVVA
ncbi:hypothetical protein [Vibrio tritonius]|uniref:hypothetical protein n=1 Tax=Vibrio tritonius TaxID=1435069 RepID=UPI00315DBE88